MCIIPVQLRLFSVSLLDSGLYPGLQSHSNEPGILVQMELSPHISGSMTHSSLSVNENQES